MAQWHLEEPYHSPAEEGHHIFQHLIKDAQGIEK